MTPLAILKTTISIIRVKSIHSADFIEIDANHVTQKRCSPYQSPVAPSSASKFEHVSKLECSLAEAGATRAAVVHMDAKRRAGNITTQEHKSTLEYL